MSQVTSPSSSVNAESPYQLMALADELQTHVFSYLDPKEGSAIYTTSSKICNLLYRNHLLTLRNHAQFAKFLPKEKELMKRYDCRSITSNLYNLTYAAQHIADPMPYNESPYSNQLLKIAKYAKATVPRNYSNYNLLEPLADKTSNQAFLLAAIAGQYPLLRTRNTPDHYFTTSSNDLLSVIHLLNVPPNCDETAFNKFFFPLLTRTIVFRSDFIIPVWLDSSRQSLITLLLDLAAQKDLPRTFTQLLELQKTEGRDEPQRILKEGSRLLCALCKHGVQTTYVKELINSSVPINYAWVTGTGYDSNWGTARGLHYALMAAANRNNLELMQTIFDARPGDQIDRRILEDIRDLFQPHLMQVNSWHRDTYDLVSGGLRQRHLAFPDADSVSAIRAVFDNEISMRYPEPPAQNVNEVRAEEEIPQEVLFADAAEEGDPLRLVVRVDDEPAGVNAAEVAQGPVEVNEDLQAEEANELERDPSGFLDNPGQCAIS